MSLTGTHHAFAGLGERGVNAIIGAFFGARPRYLHYGTIPFVGSTSVTATNVPTIAFPGIPGGISYAVDLSRPQVDLYPPDGPLPPPLTLGPDHLSVKTGARITLGCLRATDSPSQRESLQGTLTPISTSLEVLAVGHPVSQYFSAGVGDIRFVLDEIEVVGIAPESLDAIIDCLLRMILNAVLSNLRLPFRIIDAQFFKLVLEAGPQIANDQIEIWGDVA